MCTRRNNMKYLVNRIDDWILYAFKEECAKLRISQQEAMSIILREWLENRGIK